MFKLANAIPVLLIVSFIFFVSSCRKKGCTDSNATTYSSGANKDDGTCRYAGSVVFWIRDSLALQMIDSGFQSLAIYMDGDLEGSITLGGQNYTAAPNCGAVNALTVDKELLSARSRTYTFRVFDDQNEKRRAGGVTLNSNTCEKFEIIFAP